MKKFIRLFVVLAAVGAFWTAGGCNQKEPAAQAPVKKIIYTCAMHHQIRRDKPGECPICGMTLVPLEDVEVTPGLTPSSAGINSKEETVSGAPREIAGLAPVRISPYKEQLIDVKYAVAAKAPLTRLIRTNGRFGGGSGDFAALASDFAAQKTAAPPARYVVADIYALDIPFVKLGQRAWVAPLSGSGPRVEGRVTAFFPYDGTQSRVTRVKVSLLGAAPPGVFANVEIEAVTDPRLSVPPSAVMDTGTRQYVFVQTAPGAFSPRPVTTGFEGDNLWEVTSGLKEGETVVDGATFLIDADSKIKAAFTENQ